jgi:hypothetical protein
MAERIEPAGIPPQDLALGMDADTWDRAEFVTKGGLTMHCRMPSAVLRCPGPVAQLPRGADLALDDLVVRDPLLGRPMAMPAFLDRRLFNDALLVWHRGAVRHESYRNGVGPADHHVVHSVSKTLTTMMVGIAIGEGRLAAQDPVARWVPELAALDAWRGVTLQHVLDMATGIDASEDYSAPDSMFVRYSRAVGFYGGSEAQRIGCREFALRELTVRACEPGSLFNYGSFNTNLLAMALEAAYGEPAVDLYERRLFARIGAESTCLLNLDPKGFPLVEGHVNLVLRDLARWGLLYLNGGRNLAGEPVVPQGFVEATIAPDEACARAFARSESGATYPGAHYRNQTWVFEPRRRFAMLGIHGQFVYFDLPRELMIAGLGAYPVAVSPLLTACRGVLWEAVGAAVQE